MIRGADKPAHRFVTWATALTATVLMPGALNGSMLPVTAHATRRAHSMSCAALGNYPVGPRAVLQAHALSRQSILPPPSPWRLAGNINISAYSGCGPPTAGTFSIHGILMGAPVVQSNGITVTVPCASSCLGPKLAEITARGAFSQEAAHARNPIYVTVNAAISSVVARRNTRIAVADLTGYLQVQPGQTAELSFLPPPTLPLLPPQTASVGTLPIVIVVFGWRGM